MEDDDNKEGNFNKETLAFTLQLVKILFYFLQLSFQNFKTNSFCIRGRHRSVTINLSCDNTSGGSKVLFGYCSKSERKKSMTVSDNTKMAKNLDDFFKNLGKKELIYQKRWRKLIEKPGTNLGYYSKH